MAHGHHRMKEITPSDTDPITDFEGNPISVEVYSVRNSWVAFKPNGNPDGETIRIRSGARSFLPCEISHVLETGTANNAELYAVWKYNVGG